MESYLDFGILNLHFSSGLRPLSSSVLSSTDCDITDHRASTSARNPLKAGAAAVNA